MHSILGKFLAFACGLLLGWFASLAQGQVSMETLKGVAAQIEKRFQGHDVALTEIAKAVKVLQDKDKPKEEVKKEEKK